MIYRLKLPFSTPMFTLMLAMNLNAQAQTNDVPTNDIHFTPASTVSQSAPKAKTQEKTQANNAVPSKPLVVSSKFEFAPELIPSTPVMPSEVQPLDALTPPAVTTPSPASAPSTLYVWVDKKQVARFALTALTEQYQPFNAQSLDVIRSATAMARAQKSLESILFQAKKDAIQMEGLPELPKGIYVLVDAQQNVHFALSPLNKWYKPYTESSFESIESERSYAAAVQKLSDITVQAKRAGLAVPAFKPNPRGIYVSLDRRGKVHYALRKLNSNYTLLTADNWDKVRGNRTHGADKDLRAVVAKAKQQGIELNLPPSLMAGYRLAPVARPVAHRLVNNGGLARYRSLILASARRQGLDENLVKAMMAAESNFQVNALSGANAIGLMQVIPSTGERYGVSAEELLIPSRNIYAGTRYLRDLSRMFKGRPDLIIAAYNAGEGAVMKYGNQVPPYTETQNYVRKVLQYYDVYSAQAIARKAKTLSRKAKNKSVPM